MGTNDPAGAGDASASRHCRVCGWEPATARESLCTVCWALLQSDRDPGWRPFWEEQAALAQRDQERELKRRAKTGREPRLVPVEPSDGAPAPQQRRAAGRRTRRSPTQSRQPAEAPASRIEAPAEPASVSSVAPAFPSLDVRERYAGFWRRALALLIDDVVLTVPLLLLLVGLALARVKQVGLEQARVEQSGVEQSGVAYWGAIILGTALYYAWMESSEWQATVGKIVLGMMVCDVDGVPLTFRRALLRHIAKFLSSVPLWAGFLMVPFTERKQALHDKVASCVVVRGRPTTAIDHNPVLIIIGTVAALFILPIIAFSWAAYVAEAVLDPLFWTRVMVPSLPMQAALLPLVLIVGLLARGIIAGAIAVARGHLSDGTQVEAERAAQAREAPADLPSPWRRMVATALDLIAVLIIIFGTLVVAPRGGGALFILPMIALLWAYYAAAEWLLGGTLSKAVLGLTVTGLHGEPIGMGRTTVHFIARIVLLYGSYVLGYVIMGYVISGATNPRDRLQWAVTIGPLLFSTLFYFPWLFSRSATPYDRVARCLVLHSKSVFGE